MAILGSSTAKCTTVINIIHAAPENEADAGTDGSGGVASGNQIVVPVDAAVDICGNAVSVLGITEAGCMETISEGSEDDKDEGQEDEEDNGQDEDEGQKDDDNGEEDEDEGHEDDNGDDKGDEEDSGKGDEGDDKPAPSADGELPVTGGALSGLVAAALAAVGAGGTGLYFARKRKAATDE